MAITRPAVHVLKGVWTNLYAAAGISVGTAVKVLNTGTSGCLLAIKATAPSDFSATIPLSPFPENGSLATVDASEVGLWAYCSSGDTYLNVQE